MRRTRPAVDPQPNPRSRCRSTRRKRQEERRRLSRGRGKSQPAARRQVDLPQHPDRKRQGPRPQAFLQRPERIGPARRLDGNHAIASQTEIGEARPMQPAMLRDERRSKAPEYRTRSRIGGSAAGLFQPPPATNGKTGRESQRHRPVAIRRRLEFDECGRIEPTPGQTVIELRRTERPHFGTRRLHGQARHPPEGNGRCLSCCKGDRACRCLQIRSCHSQTGRRQRRVSGRRRLKERGRGGSRLGMRGHTRGQARHLRAAGRRKQARHPCRQTFEGANLRLQSVDQLPAAGRLG